MNWLKLELAKAALVKKEVDGVIEQISELVSNPSASNIERTQFIGMVQARIQTLEDFYIANSVDERAIIFEKERLRLRKALQSLNAAANGSVAGRSGVETTRTQSMTGNRSTTLPEDFDLNVSSSTHQRSLALSSPANDRNMFPTVESSSVKSTGRNMKVPTPSPAGRSTISLSSKRVSQPIYSWEEKSDKVIPRSAILIDNLSFYPTPIPGFYARGDESETMSDRFIDFQIMLTQEEILTLAARKKAERPDAKLSKNIAAATSVHTSTPYVDPRRLQQELLRPN
jgi:hypothetical protein